MDDREQDGDGVRSGQVLAEAAVRVANFGELVREARIERGMTVVRLSEVTGIGRRFIHELEAGKDTVQLGRAILVAEAVGIDIVAALRAFMKPTGPAAVAASGVDHYDDDGLPEPDDEDASPGMGR